MNRIVRTLMNRDGLSKEEAMELYLGSKEEIENAIEMGDYELAEDILAGDLGLEPDYFVDMFCI